jgi:hypothetical protein
LPYLISSECGGEEAQVVVVCKVTSSLGFVRFVYSELEEIPIAYCFDG